METLRLDGFLLSFTPRQFSDIKKMLEEEGYEPDSDGLKEMILDGMKEPPSGYEKGKSLGGTLSDVLAQNPELVGAGLKAAGNLVQQFTRKRR